MYFDINLKLLPGKNTQKVNKQNIQDSQNWVFDEMNEIHKYILQLRQTSGLQPWTFQPQDLTPG